MNQLELAGVGLLYVLFGLFLTLYARRLSDWIAASSAKLIDFIPWLNFSGKTTQQALADWKKSPTRFFETLWIWGVRVMGIIIMVFGFIFMMTVR